MIEPRGIRGSGPALTENVPIKAASGGAAEICAPRWLRFKTGSHMASRGEAGIDARPPGLVAGPDIPVCWRAQRALSEMDLHVRCESRIWSMMPLVLIARASGPLPAPRSSVTNSRGTRVLWTDVDLQTLVGDGANL